MSFQQKFGDGFGGPSSLEDEGIFVGKKPIVPRNLQRRAEKRILEECALEKKVFGNELASERSTHVVLADRSMVWRGWRNRGIDQSN